MKHLEASYNEGELFEVEQTLHETTQNLRCLPRAETWRLMYPEVASEDNLVGTGSNNTSKSHEVNITEETVQGSNHPVVTNRADAGLESFSSKPSIADAGDILEKPCSSGMTPQAFSTVSELKDGADTEEADHTPRGYAIDPQPFDVTHESVLLKESAMDSPKIQVMERDEGYDPDRIPASVFSRSDSLTPRDWSTASNDSLFSIQVGNTSFSLGEESGIYGELSKRDELLLFSPSLASTREAGGQDNNDYETDCSVKKSVAADEMKRDGRESHHPVDRDKARPQFAEPVTRPSDVSNQSNESDDSTTSFAFPILTPATKTVSVKTGFPQQQLHSADDISEASTSRKRSGRSCFYRFSCFSCTSCCTCKFCSSRASHSSCSLCSSLLSCKCCRSCFSCGSCYSCFSCSCWSSRPHPSREREC